MIIEIIVENYRSISAAQTLSFVAEAAPRHEENLIHRPGYNLLKAAALFGANASGKSNFIKAIAAMQKFVTESATRMNIGDSIMAAEPFRLDNKQRSSPSSFAIKFITDGLLYEYGFRVSRDRVHAEWLSAQPEDGRKEILGFQRTYDVATGQYVLNCRGLLKPEEELLRKRTRDNALMLSVGARENVEVLQSAYSYLRGCMRVYDMAQQGPVLEQTILDRCHNDLHFRAQIEQVLRDSDTGIDSLRFKHSDYDQLYEPSLMREPLFRMPRKPSPVMMSRSREGELIEFNFENEISLGTQRLFALSGLLLSAILDEVIVVIDEFDASMHPLLTRRLLELFQSEEANQNGAQLLLTTHDPALFDQELFRRDQIWLVEKRKGASEFFSLADIDPKPRNTEAFLRNYLAGHYGGTPSLGRLFETDSTVPVP